MKLKHAVAFIGSTICAVACSNDSPVAPTTSKPLLSARAPIGVLVSDPRLQTSVTGLARNVVYVSARPGTFYESVLVVVTNSTRSAPPQTAKANGGFDPIAIEAEAGDDLILTVSSYSGVKSRFSTTVPLHAAPVVVRTDPINSEVDVALDSRVHVIFSEPIDVATVNSSSVALYSRPFDAGASSAGDSPVAATMSVAPSGCEIVLSPEGALSPGTDYSVRVTSAVRDVGGDALQPSSITAFQTIFPPVAITREIVLRDLLIVRSMSWAQMGTIRGG